MRLNTSKLQCRSTLNDYQHFSGWESKQQAQNNNIFKQLRDNLHDYQHNYNQQHCDHLISRKIKRTFTRISKNNKENSFKLPAIQTTPKNSEVKVPSFSDTKNKTPLLEERNSLKSIRKTPILLFQMNRDNSRPKFSDVTNKLQKHQVSKDEIVFVKKNRLFNISKTLKYSKLRQQASSKLIQYEFSDEKIVQYRRSPSKDAHFRSDIQNE